MKALLLLLLSELKIPYSKIHIKDIFENHPSYPNIQSLSDYLFEIGIGSMQINLPKGHLKEIDFPCLAKLNSNEYVMLTSIENDKIKYINQHHKQTIETIEVFKKKWNGILLLIEKYKYSGEVNLKLNKKLDRLNVFRKTSIWFGVIILLIIPILFSSSLNQFSLKLLYFIKYLGVVVTILLIQQHIGGSSLVDKLCNFSNKVSCNAVLQSKSSKIFSWLALSDLGFIYFLGTLFSLFFTNDTLYLLAILNITGITLSLYLLYIQFFNIKKWCPLCITLTILLWSEFIILSKYLPPNQLNISTIAIVLFGFLISSWIIILFKKPFQRSIGLTHCKKRNNMFTKNAKIIAPLIEQSSTIKQDFAVKNEIVLGNPDAPNTLIVITNPICEPCKASHKKVMRLYEQFSSDLNIKYRFFINNKDCKSPEVTVSKAFIMFNQANEENKTIDLMNSWYKPSNKTDVNKWISDNNIFIKEDLNYNEIFVDNITWCVKNNIQSTPTLILNNKIIPIHIDTNNLKYYLRDLID